MQNVRAYTPIKQVLQSLSMVVLYTLIIIVVVVVMYK